MHISVKEFSNFQIQECIPVECIPPTAVAVSCGGSDSVHAGIHPLGVGLENPPRCGPREPPARPFNFAPGCAPGDPPDQTPQLPPSRPCNSPPPPGVGLETPPSQTPQLPPGCGPGDLQGMLGYHPHQQND